MSSYTFRRPGPQMDALFDEIPTKQKEISVTAMPNGNIRLGNLQGGDREFMPATPSGDPMHYMYEQWGARWNAESGYWELNGLLDLTNADMRLIWDTRYFPTAACRYTDQRIRTNLYRYVGLLTYDTPQTGSALFHSKRVEVVKVHDKTTHPNYPWRATVIERMFYNCKYLKRVIGEIVTTQSAPYTNAFWGCEALEEVYIKGLKHNISIAYSGLFKKEPLLYLIVNAAPTSPITITVHADVYAWAMADADILAALNAQPNISLVTA